MGGRGSPGRGKLRKSDMKRGMDFSRGVGGGGGGSLKGKMIGREGGVGGWVGGVLEGKDFRKNDRKRGVAGWGVSLKGKI